MTSALHLHLRRQGRLIYNYRRDLDPQIGRYAESDPIGLRGGLNTYAYALSNPIRYIDANGLDSYSGNNFAGTNWPALPEKQPSGCDEQCPLRWPDFATVQLDFYVGAVSLTLTQYGDVFFGKGFGRQYPNPFGVGVSLSDGWLLKCRPSQKDLNDFLLGWSASVGLILPQDSAGHFRSTLQAALLTWVSVVGSPPRLA